MTRIRLEFDIDGDVYPELLAALSVISDEASRAERLRQLAATGLIWEAVRLHGHPASLPVSLPVSMPASTTINAPIEQRAPVAATGSPARKSPRAAPRPPARRRSDFVDLAIDAPPSGPQALDDEPLTAPRSLDRVAEAMPRNLPVLFDVVEPEAPAVALPMTPAPRPARQAAELHDAVEAPTPLAPPALVEKVDDAIGLDDPAEDAAAQVAVTTPNASKRSRLQRMKERGLFKNG